MRKRSVQRMRPGIERLEARQTLNAGPSTNPLAMLGSAPRAAALQQFEELRRLREGRIALANQRRLDQVRAALPAQTAAGPTANAAFQHQPRASVHGFTIDRITNPTPVSAIFNPPFQFVRVQTRDPIPGQSYNAIYISVRNRTHRTFTAADGMTVKVTTQGPGHNYPILTGDQVWKPGQTFVFYFLTKKYYTSALNPPASAGFAFNFTEPRVVAIPGPSGIFQRIVYNPETFPNVLQSIVIGGPGAKGHRLGLPDTDLWEIVPTSKADIL